MRTLRWLFVAAATVMLAGCAREDESHAEAEPSPLQLFEKGKGVRLPDDMAKAFGIETLEVAGKAFVQRVEVVATVYQSGSSKALARATALLKTEVADGLMPGQTVKLRSATDAGSNVISGRLQKLESQAVAFGQVEALIEFDDIEGRYLVGTSLLATFTGAERKADHAVPFAAIIQGAETPFVYAVNGSHFVRTAVKVGARSEGWVEITDGLYAGDVIVAKGGEEMWMIELCALKGGTPCCPVGKKPGRTDD